MGWVRVGEPITLPVAACMDGLKITVPQMKQLMLTLGIDIPKGLKKPAPQALLIEHCLDEGEGREAALAKINDKVCAQTVNGEPVSP